LTDECKKQLAVYYAIGSRSLLPSSNAVEITHLTRYAPKETETIGFLVEALSGFQTVHY
jgi:hypothetical protein